MDNAAAILNVPVTEFTVKLSVKTMADSLCNGSCHLKPVQKEWCKPNIWWLTLKSDRSSQKLE
jgi:hypothetical protein